MAGSARGPWNVIRVLSKLGYCSRAQAVDLVKAGRVTVDGRTTRDPGHPCPFDAALTVDGRPVAAAERRYLLYHKPRGVVTTRSDELGRPTIYDRLGDLGAWLAPVGRLDLDTEGLLLLTNDTRLASWLTDPANAVRRVYVVTVRPGLRPADLERLRAGLEIGRDDTATPARVRPLGETAGTSTVELVLTEGRNREVRRIFRALARRVVCLRRTAFGPFDLGELPTGAWIELDPSVARKAVWPRGDRPR